MIIVIVNSSSTYPTLTVKTLEWTRSVTNPMVHWNNKNYSNPPNIWNTNNFRLTCMINE